ncbi:MAG: class I SAM-dependent methyltransferase [Candidatus Berkiellales bacterium]
MDDKLIAFKEAQKKSWGVFVPLEVVTAFAAPSLVKFSGIQRGQTVLDVGCGTGVVAITAARLGVRTYGLDLTPELIQRARENATIAKVEVDFKEGDVESIPYPDNMFDAVLSQYGHMFAPRPKVAIQEMLRVLKPGGIIAFSTWPPDFYVGRLFNLVAKYLPPPEGISPPSLWGEPNFIRQQLGEQVENLLFDLGVMYFPALSTGHYRQTLEKTLGPVVKLVQDCKEDPKRLQQFRTELEMLAMQYWRDNYIQQHFLMSRAVKKPTRVPQL